MKKEEAEFYERLEKKGISRRDFMKYCGAVTATIGLSSSFVPQVAEVFAAPKQRPPVIWLHFGECTGCSEAAIRTMYPWIDELVLEILDIAYHETIMAAAGHQAEDALHAAAKKYKGKYICIVEGAIATKYNGGYGKIAGRSFMEIAKEIVPNALATICIGSCACYGGIQAAKPNPGGYKERRRCFEHQAGQYFRLSTQSHQPGGYRCQLSTPRETARPGRVGTSSFCLRSNHS